MTFIGHVVPPEDVAQRNIGHARPLITQVIEGRCPGGKSCNLYES